jgi:NTE family protein
MKVGLVLSGGGSRGAAHVGAIKALEESGIVPTHIAGSSVGAIVGALYAYGHNWKTIFDFLKKLQPIDITKYALNKPGLIDTEKFYSHFKEYLTEDNFNVLTKKLTITATDILKGNLVIFNEGELIKPVLASSAFPGIFAPVKIKQSYYVDGSTLNNFPVESLISDCDIIIGIHVNGFQEIKLKDLKYSYNVIERVFKLKSAREDYKKFSDCDLVIAPKKLNKYGTFDKKHLQKIFEIGYKETKEKLTMSALQKMGLTFKVTQYS